MSDSVPYLKPHTYSPSAMHMGDCSVCGYPEQNEIHADTPAQAPADPAKRTAIDLADVKARYETAKREADADPWSFAQDENLIELVIDEFPALIAEVEALRERVAELVALLHEALPHVEQMANELATGPVAGPVEHLVTAMENVILAAALDAIPEEPKP